MEITLKYDDDLSKDVINYKLRQLIKNYVNELNNKETRSCIFPPLKEKPIRQLINKVIEHCACKKHVLFEN